MKNVPNSMKKLFILDARMIEKINLDLMNLKIYFRILHRINKNYHRTLLIKKL